MSKFTASEFEKSKSSTSWPFKGMELNDVVSYSLDDDELLARKAQRMCHTYGAMNSMKFSSKTMTKDDERFVVIMRVK